jgi:hypothetical protein
MPLFRRIVAVAVFVGLSLIALSRLRPRGYNRLFLYAGRSDDFPFGRAAVATIAPDRFVIESEFTYSDWSFVTSAANGENKWLLFHNGEIGTAIGLIDDHFIFRIRQFYPADASNFPWSYAVVDGRGCLMLAGLSISTPGKLTLGFAQVLNDGSYIEWWREELPEFPFFFGTPLIGLRNAHAWFINASENGPATVYIFNIKLAQILSSRQWSAPLRRIVADGELIFLYFDDDLKTTELCILNSNWELVTIKRKEFDFDAYTVAFDDIASTPGAHLLYSHHTVDSDGAIRVLSHDGFKLTKRLSNMDWRYQYIVPC